jgi:iron transport multicopper oxidase
VPGGVDYALNLNFAFGNVGTFYSVDALMSDGEIQDFKFTVNGATFVPPSTPVLLQILSGARSASNLLPSGSVYPLPKNASIELTLPGGVVGGGVSRLLFNPCNSCLNDFVAPFPFARSKIYSFIGVIWLI